MRIGFSGTREGMNSSQRAQLVQYILNKTSVNDVFIHGDCVGADAEFHDLCTQHNRKIINIYPPDIPTMRAFKQCDVIFPCQSYLTRNKSIVDNADVLIACPLTREVSRSGTWSTIKYAKKKIDVVVFF